MRIEDLKDQKLFRKDRYFEGVGYEPHEGQEAIHYDNSRHRVVACGRRWGKTLLGAKESEPCAFVRNHLGEFQRGWIVGPEYTDCEKEFRIIYDTFKRLGIDTLSNKFLNNVDNGNMHIKTNWGFDLECRSAKHPETLVGEGLDFVLMVEAGRHKRTTWAQYIRPALSDKLGWSMHSGVPEGSTANSLFYQLYQRGQDPAKRPWQSWRMPSWTNTVVFPGGRTDEEILEAEDDLTEDEFARQYGAEFSEKVGRVMQEWDDDVHLVDVVFNPNWPLYAAVDFGYVNPFVWLWIQIDPFGTCYVIDEHYFTFKDTDRIATDEIKNHPYFSKLAAFYPDPAEPDDIHTLQRILKVPARMNTGGERRTRDALIRSKLKPRPPNADPVKQTADLLISRRCTKLAWEMREGYRWPEHKSERSDSEKPMDKDDHGPEALGRFCKGYFGIVGEGKRRGARVTRARMRAHA